MVLTLQVLCTVSLAWWFAQLVLLLGGARRMAKVASLSATPPGAWPKLSLVMPARNEAAVLDRALEIKLASSYPNLELVLVNDRSTDETGAIADRYAAKDPRLTVVHLTTLPPDWLGKLHAMAKGFEATTGDYVLFSDADVEIAPGVFERVIAECERRQLDFLAVFPAVRLSGLLMNLALGTMFRVLLLFSRPWAVRDPRSNAYMGVGAFNLVRRSALARTKGLEWLKLETGDDVALGWMMKRAGFRCDAILGGDEVALDFYPTFGAMVRAVEKNGGSAPFPALVGGIGVMTMVELGFFAGFALPAPWSWSAAGVLLIAPFVAFLSSRWLRYPAWSSPITWAGVLVLGVVMIRSAVLCLVRGGVRWRDTFYPIDTIAAGRRMFSAKRESVLLDPSSVDRDGAR